MTPVPTLDVTFIIKTVIGIVILFIIVSAFKSAGTLWDNMWTRHDNKVKQELAAAQKMAYAQGVAEEAKRSAEHVKELYAEMNDIRAAQQDENKEIRREYQEKLDKDIVGRLEELESDVEAFAAKAAKATRRKFDDKERLSDLSTVQ